MSTFRAKPAAPFGLEKGLKAEDMHFDIVEINPGSYCTNCPPKTHSFFSMYILRVAPISGLYWIKGVSSDIDTDSSGSILKLEADKMIERLEKIYGPAEKELLYSPGTIWEEPEDFMMGLVNFEIYYSATWSKDSHDIPEGLESIYLGINAQNTNTGNVVIEYEFDNHDEGEKEIEEAEDDAL